MNGVEEIYKAVVLIPFFIYGVRQNTVCKICIEIEILTNIPQGHIGEKCVGVCDKVCFSDRRPAVRIFDITRGLVQILIDIIEECLVLCITDNKFGRTLFGHLCQSSARAIKIVERRGCILAISYIILCGCAKVTVGSIGIGGCDRSNLKHGCHRPLACCNEVVNIGIQRIIVKSLHNTFCKVLVTVEVYNRGSNAIHCGNIHISTKVIKFATH